MKRALYIGVYTQGSTSRMRGEQLKELLPNWDFSIIDTDIPFVNHNSVFRSIGFRFKIGPVITSVNQYIFRNLTHDHYDLIWVDKAIFLTKGMTAILKKRAGKLIHYTPDMAYYNNRSNHFFNSIKYYDYLVTTKKAEIDHYLKAVPKKKLILVSQGFDKAVHVPVCKFKEKKDQVAFIGLNEKSREVVLQHLIDNKIKVVLAGYKWEPFVQRNANNPFLEYLGTALFGKAYVEVISSSYFSLGLLSKHFPELHTTRTFEIPACGTALITETNEELRSFYTNEEAIFFTDLDDLTKKIRFYQANTDHLEELTNKGFMKVHASGYDYKSILGKIVNAVLN
jgi:spore maturation protein CgeB